MKTLLIRIILLFCIQNVPAKISDPEPDKDLKAIRSRSRTNSLFSSQLFSLSSQESDISDEPNDLVVQPAIIYRGRSKRQVTAVRRVRVLRRLRKHRDSPNDVIAEDEKAAEEIFKDIEAQHGLQPPPSNDGFIEISKDGSSLPPGVHPPALPHFGDIAEKQQQHDSTQGPLPIEEPQTMVPPAVVTAEISNSMSGDTMMDQASNYGGEVIKEATTNSPEPVPMTANYNPPIGTEVAITIQPYEPSTASYVPLTQTESYSGPVKTEYSHRIEAEVTTLQPYTKQVTLKYIPTSISSSQIQRDPDPFFDRPDEAPRAKPIYGFGSYSRSDSLNNPFYSNGYSRPLPSILPYQAQPYNSHRVNNYGVFYRML